MTHKPNYKEIKIDELRPTTIERFCDSESDGIGRDIAYLGLEVIPTKDQSGIGVFISPDKDIATVQIQRFIEVLENNNYYRMAAMLKLCRIFVQKVL